MTLIYILAIIGTFFVGLILHGIFFDKPDEQKEQEEWDKYISKTEGRVLTEFWAQFLHSNGLSLECTKENQQLFQALLDIFVDDYNVNDRPSKLNFCKVVEASKIFQHEILYSKEQQKLIVRPKIK